MFSLWQRQTCYFDNKVKITSLLAVPKQYFCMLSARNHATLRLLYIKYQYKTSWQLTKILNFRFKSQRVRWKMQPKQGRPIQYVLLRIQSDSMKQYKCTLGLKGYRCQPCNTNLMALFVTSTEILKFKFFHLFVSSSKQTSSLHPGKKNLKMITLLL